jgi:ABC-type phosphate transport system substrate-binding protein
MRKLALPLLLALAGADARAAGGVAVIGHQGLAALDPTTLEKIYTGKVVELHGISVVAVNASSGSALRSRFLRTYLNQDDDKYTAYWIVRRYIGKGASPRELPSPGEVIDFVKQTPGAIGYIDEADVRPEMNVLLR